MIEVQNVTHARGLIERLLMADTTQVPAIVAELAGYRRWTDSALATIVAESAPGTKRRLHASLALLPVRPDQIDYLRGSLASADPPAAKVLAASLRPHQARLVDTLWKELRSARPGDPRFLPTASLLADYDPASSAWADVSVPLAEEMVKAHVDDVKGWMEALWNVRSYLIDPLEAIYRKKDRPEIDQTIATTLLARYAADQPRFIVDLLLDAKPPSFAILFPVIRDDAEVAVPELSSAIDRAMADPGGEPDPAASDEVATRSSRAAVALLELGHDEKVWRLLAYKPDPIARSSLIDALPAYRVPIDGLVRELDRLRTNGSGKPMQPGANQAPNQSYLFDPGTSLLRGILQALAGYPADEMAPLGKRNLCAKVLEIHATNPDAGVHSAAELLLRRWGEGRAVRETPDAPAIAATSPRRWSVNQAGLTMVLIDGPVEFTMGSPPSDPERENGDIRHSRKIPRAFAIASREVTIRQYEAFATATNRPMPQYSRRYSPDKGGPQIKVDWFDAALYCNWLSRAEHLQPCYERTKSTSGADLTFNFNAAAAAQGAYRLPTEAEWEYACRAGTTSCRFYGHNPLLLKNYEWYVENSGDRAHPGGLLLPNDLGLFDTLGNVAEWCHDRWHDSTINFAMPIDDILVDETMPRAHRHHRGQTFHDTPSTVRAGTRTWINPTEPRNDIGFRPARTIPARGH
jgi:formylglycine-generating enzyme required for sulfatase activity